MSSVARELSACQRTACKVETHSCRHAMKTSNKEKNQNQKCIPYDYNRVVLEPLEETPDSDYVNASYVDSLLKPNAYIVTQGPTENTVTDFWRMVWQENASCIVMLTKTFDFIKVMCMQYWPASKDLSETHGGIKISILKEEELANFHIRIFRLVKKEGGEDVVRDLIQFHYTQWHSHTCPFSNAILEFRRRVRSVVGTIQSDLSGPMVVHCNDGGGRSGVYLAVDANMELMEEEDAFDDQYKFVYDTLEEFVSCGNSWFPVKELSARLKQKSIKNPLTKINEYQHEYQLICKQTPRFTIGDCAGGHRADNREKNRDVLIVPPDNFRPYLTSFQGNNFTDYINAVFVDGYTKPREYIVTEWPLKNTCGEFWSLVYDYECSAVVVLCVPPLNSDSKQIHRRSIYVSGDDHRKIVSLTELMAGVKAPPRTVQLFQLGCWPMGHKVPTSTNSLVELMNMVERWRQRTDYGPVTVVSPDGRGRCGVYCAANACIEQVIQHGEVDVFQAVKTVRRHRPQLVENMTEYKYCYDLVLHYVLHYLNKDMKEKNEQEQLWYIDFGRGSALPQTPEEPLLHSDELAQQLGARKRLTSRWNCCSCELLSPCCERSHAEEHPLPSPTIDRSLSELAVINSLPVYSGEVVAARRKQPHTRWKEHPPLQRLALPRETVKITVAPPDSLSSPPAICEIVDRTLYSANNQSSSVVTIDNSKNKLKDTFSQELSSITTMHSHADDFVTNQICLPCNEIVIETDEAMDITCKEDTVADNTNKDDEHRYVNLENNITRSKSEKVKSFEKSSNIKGGIIVSTSSDLTFAHTILREGREIETETTRKRSKSLKRGLSHRRRSSHSKGLGSKSITPRNETVDEKFQTHIHLTCDNRSSGKNIFFEERFARQMSLASNDIPLDELHKKLIATFSDSTCSDFVTAGSYSPTDEHISLSRRSTLSDIFATGSDVTTSEMDTVFNDLHSFEDDDIGNEVLNSDHYLTMSNTIVSGEGSEIVLAEMELDCSEMVLDENYSDDGDLVNVECTILCEGGNDEDNFENNALNSIECKYAKSLDVRTESITNGNETSTSNLYCAATHVDSVSAVNSLDATDIAAGSNSCTTIDHSDNFTTEHSFYNVNAKSIVTCEQDLDIAAGGNHLEDTNAASPYNEFVPTAANTDVASNNSFYEEDLVRELTRNTTSALAKYNRLTEGVSAPAGNEARPRVRPAEKMDRRVPFPPSPSFAKLPAIGGCVHQTTPEIIGWLWPWVHNKLITNLGDIYVAYVSFAKDIVTPYLLELVAILGDVDLVANGSDFGAPIKITLPDVMSIVCGVFAVGSRLRDCAQAVLGLCHVATIHTDRTVLGLCHVATIHTDRTVLGLCHVATIHTDRTVLGLCHVPENVFSGIDQLRLVTPSDHEILQRRPILYVILTSQHTSKSLEKEMWLTDPLRTLQKPQVENFRSHTMYGSH
uniref:Receptor-type tyrosine-protein phosphatase kappa n=1 Tax=Timema monikensis TaxID=170555 RepID=A0A7R9E5X6_9NEOP|nr:unnamed protein product [Timema monikensis]